MAKLNKISLLAGGSRGDIQPYIAIGMALKRAGYEVRILTNSNHAFFVEDFNLQCIPVFADSEEMLRDPTVMHAMACGDAAKFFECVDAVQKVHAPNDAQNYWNEIRANVPDLLIIGSLGLYYGYYASLVLNIPMLMVNLQALTHDPNRAPWVLPTLPDGKHQDIVRQFLGSFYDGFEHFDKAMISMGADELMPIFPKSNFLRNWEEPLVPILICQSPLFAPILYPQAPANMHFVGASIIDSVQQKERSENFGGSSGQEDIAAFLDRDPTRKPVYCGWGSMTCKSSEYMVVFAVRALQLSGQRGIILGGWAGLSMDVLRDSVADTSDENLIDYAEQNVLFVEKAAHEILFPQVACIVHHGGAGTTNAALRSGVPTIITPVFVDQYDHAHLVNELGVGVGFSTQLQQMLVADLAAAIQSVVMNESILNRAKDLSHKLRQEDGAQAIVEKTKEFWDDYVHTGKFHSIVDKSLKEHGILSRQESPATVAVASQQLA